MTQKRKIPLNNPSTNIGPLQINWYFNIPDSTEEQ